MLLSSVVVNFIESNDLNSSDEFMVLSELLELDGHNVSILKKAISEFRELEFFFKDKCRGFGLHAELRNKIDIFHINFYITRRLKGFPWIRVLRAINDGLDLNSYPTILISDNGFLRTMCYEYEFNGFVVNPSSFKIEYKNSMRLWIRSLNIGK